MVELSGNIEGLKPSQLRALRRLGRRKVLPQQAISWELAQEMAEISTAIHRQVGILLARSGHIAHVFVGSAQRIYLPDIGRARVGLGHFRGIRHIHTVLPSGTSGRRSRNNAGQALRHEDISDLTKLRLDAVAALSLDGEGQIQSLTLAHLLPGQAGALGHRVETWPLGDAQPPFLELIEGLEAEYARLSAPRRAAGPLQQAALVGIYSSQEEAQWRIAEMHELAATAGLTLVSTTTQIRRQSDPRYVVGHGKLEECVLQCLAQDVDLLVFDSALTPTQARSIAAASSLRALDRTQLILDIFAQHAKSRDGKLQVELAQLKYNLPRLTDLDAGLSRLTGGIGGRGPGETKLEINRRRARARITALERTLQDFARQRSLRRQRRARGGQPVVAIVGYTNAGKSTLLNALANSDVEVADKLFATLDPSVRRCYLPPLGTVIMADTVGFIHDLPDLLVDAFGATLEELHDAALLLHVVDASSPRCAQAQQAVEKILKDLHLDTLPTLLVGNKCDTLPRSLPARAWAKDAKPLLVSATQGTHLPALRTAIAAKLQDLQGTR